MNAILPDNKYIEKPDQKILTIYTGDKYLSFSLHNPAERGSFFFKELTEENQVDAFTVLKEAFLNNEFFALPFRKVLVMSHTPTFTYIPNSVYKGTNEEDFMQFLFTDHKGITLNHTISIAECKVLFKLTEDIYNFALRSFAKPEFIHYSEPLITFFLKNSKSFKNRRMIVNLKENGLDIFCFSRKTFLLGNYFKCNNIQEALYFILFTWKQLQFNQLDDSLYFWGDISFGDELKEKLKQYLQQVFPLEFPAANHFESVETSRIPIELAMLSVCGL